VYSQYYTKAVNTMKSGGEEENPRPKYTEAGSFYIEVLHYYTVLHKVLHLITLYYITTYIKKCNSVILCAINIKYKNKKRHSIRFNNTQSTSLIVTAVEIRRRK